MTRCSNHTKPGMRPLSPRFVLSWLIDIHPSHLVAIVLDSDRENPLFRSPVKDPQQVLDIGTAKGIWAMCVIHCCVMRALLIKIVVNFQRRG